MPLHHPLVSAGVDALVTLVSFDFRALLDVVTWTLLKKIAIKIGTVTNSVTVSVPLNFHNVLTLVCAHRAPVQVSFIGLNSH